MTLAQPSADSFGGAIYTCALRREEYYGDQQRPGAVQHRPLHTCLR